MSEPTIICPKCKAEIKLTESLAAPLLESIRHDYEDRLTKKDADNMLIHGDNLLALKVLELDGKIK